MRQLRALLIALVLALGLTVMPLLPAQAASTGTTGGAPVPVRNPNCHATLSVADRQDLIASTDMSTITGFDDVLPRVEHILDIFLRNHDNAGLFPLVYGEITRRGTDQIGGNGTEYADPAFVDRLMVEFFRLYLKNLKAYLTGGRMDPQWRSYYQLASDCNRTIGRVAAAGINAHMVGDFPFAIRAAGATWANYEDYMKIGIDLVKAIPVISAATQSAYGADLTQPMTIYWVGKLFDSVTQPNMSPLMVFQAVRWNAFVQAMMLTDRGLVEWVKFLSNLMWGTADLILSGLEANNLL
ncbi:MAG TPA: DUF5995 family protein [Marmoricola sp.]|nr:DUF5995 family protein [Marmoricola sp.]HNJ78322.1 DUF5995 family protein [Marmoricola sp.]HNN48357.1 DUF5995 family protein [Marmoricola sp.]